MGRCSLVFLAALHAFPTKECDAEPRVECLLGVTSCGVDLIQALAK
jgi:hypothetical protein